MWTYDAKERPCFKDIGSVMTKCAKGFESEHPYAYTADLQPDKRPLPLSEQVSVSTDGYADLRLHHTVSLY